MTIGERASPPGTPRPGRVSFFDEQARRRREARGLSLVCLLIASGVGIVLSAAVTPLLLLLGGGLLHLAAALGIAPSAARAAADGLGIWAGRHLDNFEQLVATLDRIGEFGDAGVLLAPLAKLSPVAVPALVAAGLVWLALRRMLASAGGEDLIHRVNGRVAAPSDREERQLANIVEEIAIAAGMPAPRLYVIDSPMVNAAALGRSSRDAAVLVTRGLLERLDRAESSAVIGHLIASIAGGDVRLGASVLAVFQTFGLFLTVLDLPFRRSAWRTLGGIALIAATPQPSAERVARAGESLEAGLGAETMPDIDKMLAWIPYPAVRYALLAPLLPFMLVSMLLKLVLFLWTALLLGPPLALLWRNRRYIADAKAVELTRDPDALARALSGIANSAVPPGGEFREYLFINAPRSGARNAVADRHTMAAALHPPLGRRLARLIALGAQREPPPTRFRPSAIAAALRERPAATVAVLLLAVLLVPLGLMLVMLVFYLTAIAMTIALAAGLALAWGLLAP